MKKDTVYAENAAQALDFAIKQSVPDASVSEYYEIDGVKRYNYMSNAKWEQFVADMQANYKRVYDQYKKGGGKELWASCYKSKIPNIPPKMASYGSSSRMIYLLSRDIGGFQFERQLATTVGGTANMDGFINRCGEDIYIEAKCREPYSNANGTNKKEVVSTKYETLYQVLQKANVGFSFLRSPHYKKIDGVSVESTNSMRVEFSIGGKKFTHFDLKQAICHLLGIATYNLTHPTAAKTRFLYMLYNPEEVINEFSQSELSQTKLLKQKVLDSYEKELEQLAAMKVTMKVLYGEIVKYLCENFYKDATERVQRTVDDFTFDYCDQTTYLKALHLE